ncbi:MAG TPA: ATP-binding protein [Acidimicrobiia bacterium]|jgi:signal transduction histidine kinase
MNEVVRATFFSSPIRRLATCVAVAVLIGAIATALRPGLGETVGPPLMLVNYVMAGYLFLRGSRVYDGRERLAWRLIGVACFFVIAGLLTFGLATVAGYTIPAFGPLDTFFIIAYLIYLAGFWVLPHLDGIPIRRLRVFVDGMVGAVAVAVLSWVWFLDEILEELSHATFWDVVIGGLYPLIDVVTLVVVIVVTLRRSTLRFDPRVLLMGAGFAVQAVADLIYLRNGIGQSFVEANPSYAALLFAGVAFLVAAITLETPPPAREYAERATPWWALIAPYGAAVLLIVVLVVRMMGVVDADNQDTIQLLAGAVVIVCLIIFRQALAIRETRELVEQQRSQLVSSISHELRTPLTAMVGFLDILADPDQQMDPEARKELIGIVNQQANYMARIVSDLVMLNRANPDLGLQERVHDVREVIKAAVSSLDVESSSGIDIEVQTGLAAHFDSDRIHQILVNLLTNAARYGGPRRLVVAKRVGDDLVLEVHDDGPGVPKRYEILIWDRFERGAHRYNAAIPGSGIGLALVSMLVRAHDGTVGYRRSERLGGACFSVVLPGRARTVAQIPNLEPVGRRDP